MKWSGSIRGRCPRPWPKERPQRPPRTPERGTLFAGVELADFESAERFVGRAPEQVDQYLERVVAPIRARYEKLPTSAELIV